MHLCQQGPFRALHCGITSPCIHSHGCHTPACRYTGDGRTCTPDAAALALIEDTYYTNFGGNCLGQPADVNCPTTSPGWVYDPTNTFPADGNRVNLTLLEVIRRAPHLHPYLSACHSVNGSYMRPFPRHPSAILATATECSY